MLLSFLWIRGALKGSQCFEAAITSSAYLVKDISTVAAVLRLHMGLRGFDCGDAERALRKACE